MLDTVECPYCQYENDMSEGTVDLPSDNKFDHECEKCEREFEVFVEFTPSYSSGEINYIACERCGKETRDIRVRGRTFPFPRSIKEDKICPACFGEGHHTDYTKEKSIDEEPVEKTSSSLIKKKVFFVSGWLFMLYMLTSYVYGATWMIFVD